MIEFKESLFLYNLPLIVRDTKGVVKLSGKLNTKQKDVPLNLFKIMFAQKIPSNIEENSSNLFSNFNIDNNYLKKHVVKEIYDPFSENRESKINILYFPNLALFKTTTKSELIYMIAYELDLNITNIEVTLNNEFICSKQLPEVLKEHNIIFEHRISLSKTNEDILDQAISIGNAFIIVNIIDNNDNRNNIYEEMFYTNYYTTATYIKKILSNTEKQKVTKYSNYINISQCMITLAYAGPKKTHSSIDITRLFNMHHISKTFSKIYIHSDNIDSYLLTPRQMQYVKVPQNSTNVFKGVTSLYNTCSLYMGLDIEKGLTLHHVEICKNMTINIIFSNTNTQYTYDDIKRILVDWMDNNMLSLLKKLKINECVYNINFNYKYYIPIFNGINASINVNDVSVNDVEGLSDIILQNIPQLRFPTRTSIQFSGYSFFTSGCYYKCMYQNIVHEFLTSNILFKDMFPIVHVGLNGPTDLTISITNGSSFYEICYMFAFIIGSFKKISVHSDVDLVKSSKLELETLRKNAMKYNKNLLKILTKIDPALFGSRKVGKNVRSFSGLCQKPKQRAVPITVDEYEYLKTVVPDSVTNLRNQTFPEQRLYLFCPYKKYGFLNYHHFPNQLCIVRCTTKPSNKTQYNYCVNALGAEHSSIIQNKYENQTITLYNPLITKGRKCRLPEELKFILVDYILLKLNINVSLTKYCLNIYDKYPFIIRRDPNNSKYLILSEYNDELDYILILQSELNDDYFIFQSEVNNKPLIFSENEEIKKFFIDNIRKTNSQYNFFNYLEKLLGTSISQYYNKINKVILQIIKDEFDIKYIVNGKFIYGVLWKNCVCLTPLFFWQFDETDFSTIQLFKAIENVMKGTYSLPDIKLFDSIYIKKLYKDYNDGMIKMVSFYGNNLLVKPFEQTAKWQNLDVITFDYQAILFNLYNINFAENDKFIDTQIEKHQIGDVLKNYIFIYTMEFGTIDEDILRQKLIALNIVFDGKTFIDYTDRNKKTFVSWRTSKININDYEDYIKKYQSLGVNDNIKNIYDKFQNEMKFRSYNDELIYSKIITT